MIDAEALLIARNVMRSPKKNVPSNILVVSTALLAAEADNARLRAVLDDLSHKMADARAQRINVRLADWQKLSDAALDEAPAAEPTETT